MNPNEKMLTLILANLFKKESQRKLVKAVVTNSVSSIYEAEKRCGISVNTGSRLVKKYEAHIEYLKSLGVKFD